MKIYMLINSSIASGIMIKPPFIHNSHTDNSNGSAEAAAAETSFPITATVSFMDSIVWADIKFNSELL